MSYTALARKWRPKSFAEMSGQEHVLTALSNALDAGRVHHAFLFTGTRGVGKTTVARIFAKCLNCELGVRSVPCGECGSCREIDAGRFLDLIEVDAASRTKVDDTRELLENVQYAPTRGRYKVYLIDEVHMLTTQSFNALLKTLEEPPPHVKFLLATTDPQKLPATVLSRCLQFNLRRLTPSLIQARLAFVLAAEGISAEPAALRLLALAADGSLRDGLSLLDHLLAFGNGVAREADALTMLGAVDRSQVMRIAQLLAAQDAAGLVAHAQHMEQWSPDHAQLLDGLISLLAQVAVLQVVPGAVTDEDLYEPAQLQDLAGRFSAADVQLYYQIGLLGRRDLPLVAEASTGFMMTLLRMLAFRPQGAAALAGSPTPQPAVASGTPVPSASRPMPATAPAPSPVVRAVPAPGPTRVLAEMTPADWPAVVAQLPLTGLARQLAVNCALVAVQGTVLRLALDPKQRAIHSAAPVERMTAALSALFATAVRLDIEVTAPPAETPASAQSRAQAQGLAMVTAALADEPVVKALGEQFGATVQADSIRLIKPGE